MIITRTPLRISLVGGGTDVESFYRQHPGAVVSMAINKYVYVSINKKFDGRIRLSYSRTENVDEPSQLSHDLAKSCLEIMNLRGVEITSVSDIPGAGSGLGSSSSFMVGLLNATSQYRGNSHPARLLAERAYSIEAGCNHGCGKQDHYIAALGGFEFFRFNFDGDVRSEPICLSPEKWINLLDSLLLFWTGQTRKSIDILENQRRNFELTKTLETGKQLAELAIQLQHDLMVGNIATLGEILDMGWNLKKKLAGKVSAPWIDRLYEEARLAGASGGKICGAGGGGFLLLCADPAYQRSVCNKMEHYGLRQVPFNISPSGSEVIYDSTKNPVSG